MGDSELIARELRAVFHLDPAFSWIGASYDGRFEPRSGSSLLGSDSRDHLTRQHPSARYDEPPPKLREPA